MDAAALPSRTTRPSCSEPRAERQRRQPVAAELRASSTTDASRSTPTRSSAHPADRTQPQERAVRRQRRGRCQPGHQRLADRDREAQRRQSSRLARRHPDQARQPLAPIPHRRTDALGLCEVPRLTRQRGRGASLTFVCGVTRNRFALRRHAHRAVGGADDESPIGAVAADDPRRHRRAMPRAEHRLQDEQDGDESAQRARGCARTEPHWPARAPFRVGRQRAPTRGYEPREAKEAAPHGKVRGLSLMYVRAAGAGCLLLLRRKRRRNFSERSGASADES